MAELHWKAESAVAFGHNISEKKESEGIPHPQKAVSRPYSGLIVSIM